MQKTQLVSNLQEYIFLVHLEKLIYVHTCFLKILKIIIILFELQMFYDILPHRYIVIKYMHCICLIRIAFYRRRNIELSLPRPRNRIFNILQEQYKLFTAHKIFYKYVSSLLNLIKVLGGHN